MELVVTHRHVEIVGEAPLSEIRELLSFKIPTDFHMLRAKMPNKPIWVIKKIASKGRTINLLNLKKEMFPTGLLPKVTDFLDKRGLMYTVNDRRKYPHRNRWDCTRQYGKRHYQRKAVFDALKHRSGILNIATRGGKTVVAQMITARIGLPTIFFVKSIELMDQAKKSWGDAFPHKKIGQIGQGVFNIQEITIAMIQTVMKFDDTFGMFGFFKVIFFDEIHSYGGTSFYKGARRFYSPYRFGLTGTAFRNDEAGILLNALCGNVITNIRTKKLVELGVVYKTKILMQYITKAPHFPMHSRDWRKMYMWGIVANDYRNNLICDWAIKLFKARYTVLIIVKEISHGNIIKEMLYDKVCDLIDNDPEDIQFMNGKERKDKRKLTLNKFCLGNLPFLIGTKIYNEGIDFVGINNKRIRGKSVILASGGKSKIDSIQVPARPTTVEQGAKNIATESLIVDFVDMFHGKLKDHSIERLRTYKNIGEFDITQIAKPLDYKIGA